MGGELERLGYPRVRLAHHPSSSASFSLLLLRAVASAGQRVAHQSACLTQPVLELRLKRFFVLT
jgi:hypothetical protein